MLVLFIGFNDSLNISKTTQPNQLPQPILGEALFVT